VAVLTALLTHLDAPTVERQVGYLRALAPDARLLVCHGGQRGDFDQLADGDAIFLEDPTLRGHHFDQSMNATLRAIYEARVRDDPEVELIYLAEYDHLILRGDFEEALSRLADRSGAGLLAKNAGPRNDTNWPHHLRFRDDAGLNEFVAGISRRADHAVRWGALGNGMLFRRDALAAFCAVADPPDVYWELFVPTVVHHLGFDVVNVDAIADLYMDVRWIPPFTVEEAIAAKRAGRAFVHPFKSPEALDAVLAAPAAKSSTAGADG
jgi:hypothetical protein